jgi:hypothetical protein
MISLLLTARSEGPGALIQSPITTQTQGNIRAPLETDPTPSQRHEHDARMTPRRSPARGLMAEKCPNGGVLQQSTPGR